MGMLVKSPLYGDVSEKPMMGTSYPFSAGTLTFVRTIEMFVEILCHCFFSFDEDD
jgi:zinc transporter ZupT